MESESQLSAKELGGDIDFTNGEFLTPIIEAIQAKTNAFAETDEGENNAILLITPSRLEALLAPEELEVVNAVQTIDTSKFGINLPKVDFGNNTNFISIKGQSYLSDNEPVNIATQFLSAVVYEKMQALNRVMEAEIGTKVLIYSGYRSPTNQALTFLRFLLGNEFNLEATVRRVALPGYSQHCNSANPAMDLHFPENEVSTDPFSFAKSEQFKYLTECAKDFGLMMPYTKENPNKIMYEPWHWQFAE